MRAICSWFSPWTKYNSAIWASIASLLSGTACVVAIVLVIQKPNGARAIVKQM
ncbi:MAG: hypothetical protein J7601_00245 [Chloroflexi bacterium]|nr:hypothetical protein [Chloroflexota bacterium]